MRIYGLRNEKGFFIIMFLIFIIAVFIIDSVKSSGENVNREYKVITVRQGDTLWDIADKYRGKTEIRKYIYRIKKLNGLDDSTIYAGQKLYLP
ncbi:hypothetical protein Cst_c15770 [Thermoclostridium stercorarium subsp. stercorarium DSM 8532]|jgi:LysM repeat protein|uniref:LysM domain-containing protein n=3 Tax=Thermoclostridium stercorarium TaxID=1510 RepID=L7VSN7_THES1|nr:LysM peptidoglycan-binding domain-containing protein [Thermoclostridium stercorarium]AGC68563.1 hypothetical protein Cst_c15770 [Thermoclostridium stercorarium subsp. stercorarium DSM 8532]AGI39579.1 LysM domain-containing protein [Thermoclostridium stercorarium subsp. stercorarium DSM 8532]ANW98913.1 hypothetical protein CSTERTH_07705 [Thermoclostridium stercorarium subsp. thermolacticum DSM 2910]ANX01440.1 hypothetical protein CSTERLE_07600 [Thermoclostridium stercorarium subsp. leptospart